jgi:uncharacterized protein (TIGR02001 family)
MKVISKLILTCSLTCIANFAYSDTTNQGNIDLAKQDSTKITDESAPIDNSASASTQSPLTGNFDITTNYVFRGISNSNNNPAFQGGLTYTFIPLGVYFNVWGSNVDFLDPQGFQATVEADTIVGITNSINDNWSYDINFDRYNYPKASAANYNELIAAVTYKIFTATIGDSLNVYGSHSNGIYYNGLFAIPVSEKLLHVSDLEFDASWGHYSLPRNAGLYSYSDVMVGLQKTIHQYVLAAQYTNTNHKAHMSGLDTGTLVATLTVNF